MFKVFIALNLVFFHITNIDIPMKTTTYKSTQSATEALVKNLLKNSTLDHISLMVHGVDVHNTGFDGERQDAQLISALSQFSQIQIQEESNQNYMLKEMGKRSVQHMNLDDAISFAQLQNVPYVISAKITPLHDKDLRPGTSYYRYTINLIHTESQKAIHSARVQFRLKQKRGLF